MLRAITTTFLALALAGYAFADFGSVVSSFQSPGGYGLAWDGSYLWYWGVGHGWRFCRVTTTGSFISSFGSGRYCEPGGATYDGRYLWCAVENNVPPPRFAVIYSYTTAGSFRSSFWHYGPGITDSTPGLACEPGYLWVGEYKYNVGGGLVASFPPPFPIYYDTAWDGKYLWWGYWGVMYQVSTSGSAVASFAVPGTPYGVTFDGEYLWADIWLNPWWTFQYDIGVTTVKPASAGRIRALYR